VLGGDMLVVTLSGGAATFIAGSIVLFIGSVFVVPYIFALLAGLDKLGRWASIGPAFVLTGVALGPGIAGVVSRGVDFTTLGYVASACVAAAMTLFICAQRLRVWDRRARLRTLLTSD
jgi:predicted MFS family arabinose efflux permease